MSAGGPSRPRLLLLSSYPLDQGSWGPTVRVASIRDALREQVELDVIAGYRRTRARAVWKYARDGRLRGLDGIYFEAPTTLPGLADVTFLGAAKGLGIPVLSYIRDAYPIFPEYATGSLRARLRSALFVPAFRALARVSSQVAFPSQGLADALPIERDVLLLPPGAPAPVAVPRLPSANRVLYVGSLAHPHLGWSLLVEAMAQVREAGADVELYAVTRRGEEPGGPRPPWLHVVTAEGASIHDLLPDVLACVVPRRRTPYNHLSVPIKLMEYLSYGRPIVVTDCTETARIVSERGCGPIVLDTVQALAQGLVQVRDAAPDTWQEWADASHRTAEDHAWRGVAVQIVTALAAARR